MEYQKKQLVNGVIWSGIDKLGVVVVQLLLEIILARHLLPKDYGVIGMATIFIALGILFSESGFSSALIQKQNRTETDFSTAFYFNLAISVSFVTLVFLIAPFAANFFNTPILKNVLRILSLGIILNALVMVHKTKLSISLDFKTQAKISFLSLLISGCLGVYLAINNYGVWSLVAQILGQNLITTILFFAVVKWIPLRVFSRESFSHMFAFGSKILAAGLLQSVYTNLYYLFIGKRMSASTLGLYTKANQFTFMPASLISGVLQRVMFPFFSSFQNEDDKIFNFNQQYTRLVCLFVFPIFNYLCIFSNPLVYIALSDRWIQIVPILQILSACYIFQPIIVNNMVLFQVKNKVKLYFQVELITKIIGIIILFVTFRYGIIALCYGLLLQLILQLIITSLYCQSILRKGMADQLLVILPYIFFSVSIWLILYLINSRLTMQLQLILGSFIFICLYLFFYFTVFKSKILTLYKLLKKD